MSLYLFVVITVLCVIGSVTENIFPVFFSFLFLFCLSRLSSLLDSSHNGPISSQTASSHHEMGDNKAPGGPTSLTSGVSSGVSVAYNDDPPGLHEKVPVMFLELDFKEIGRTVLV